MTERAAERRLTFYGRHFESPHGPPPLVGPILTHHPSWSLLRLPADAGRYAVVLAVGPDDRAMHALRDADVWDAAARCTPMGAAWLDHGRAVSDVLVHAGTDLVRDPVAGTWPDRLVAVGDARAVTNPLLGRGLSLGVLSVLALRDSLREAGGPPATRYEAAYAQRVSGLVDATVWLVRHRTAELRAEASGHKYRPDDPGWAMSVALRTGAQHDPVLARASSRIGGLLAGPAEVFADAEVRDRTVGYLGRPPHPDAATRAGLLANVSLAPAPT